MTIDDLGVQLAAVAAEQRAATQSLAQHVQTLAQQVQTLGQQIQGIDAAIEAAEARAQEFARNIETNLLTAFHGHARGQNARLHTAEVTVADFAIRLNAIEDRLLNLETRRPPQ